ncbi:hypothetical protein EON63_06710 [archaeon]|nr:MAG: hypothetical protein EON63_06710 [archaeon]
MIYKLIERLESNDASDFFLFKILRAHILPLTNCAFNKSGDKFITGSYDRTCKVWMHVLYGYECSYWYGCIIGMNMGMDGHDMFVWMRGWVWLWKGINIHRAYFCAVKPYVFPSLPPRCGTQ